MTIINRLIKMYRRYRLKKAMRSIETQRRTGRYKRVRRATDRVRLALVLGTLEQDIRDGVDYTDAVEGGAA